MSCRNHSFSPSLPVCLSVCFFLSFFLSHSLPPSLPPDFRPGAVGAETGEEFEPDVSLATHRLGVDLVDVGATLQVRQAELHLPVETAGSAESRVQSVRPGEEEGEEEQEKEKKRWMDG